MPDFDVAVGLSKSEMDQASKVVYAQLYPRLFTGSEKVDFGGAALTLTWNVKAAPTFVLAPPAQPMEMLQDHLRKARLPKNLSLELVSDIAYAELKDSVVQLIMDEFDLGIDTGTAPPAVDTLQVAVVVEVTSNGDGTLTLNPIKATATASNPSDQTLVNQFIIPRILKMARDLLKGVSLPALSIPEVALTPPTVCVQQNHVVVLANIHGQPSPSVPQDFTWPGSGFFGLFSNRLRQTLIQKALQGFTKTFSDSGSSGSSIGGVNYSASVTISVTSAGLGTNPDQFSVSVNPSGNAHAEVTFLCVPVGVNYSLSTKPETVTATIQASISGGRTVVATTRDISGFTIFLTPSGNVIETILSAITWPVTQAVIAAFSPAISSALKNISFAIWSVPDIPINVEGVTLTISPDNLALGSYAGMMMVAGTVKIH